MSGMMFIILGLLIEIAGAVILTSDKIRLKKFNVDDIIKKSNETPDESIKKKNAEQGKSFLGIYLLLGGFACQVVGIALTQLEMFAMIDDVWKELFGLRQELVENEVLKP